VDTSPDDITSANDGDKERGMYITYYCAACDWIADDLTALISPKGITCDRCGCCLSTDHANEADLDELMRRPVNV